MEQKTIVNAEPGKQDLVIIRVFDLPVEKLFSAFVAPELVSHWIGTKVVKLDARKHGSYRFETANADGNILFSAHGAIHECIENRRITRTFEMENAQLGVQLELLNFEPLTENTSKLSMHIIYESPELREKQLLMPFAWGINMAHNRLQDIMAGLK